MQFTVYIQGLGICFGLIVAIGAQNAYALSRSLRNESRWPVAVTCMLCDIVLITLGVMGLGSLIASKPLLSLCATSAGILFLFWFGFSALRAAWKSGDSLRVTADSKLSRRSAVLGAIAVSVLNPHAFLDTVVLLGSISTTFAEEKRLVFALGAMTASILWFSLLGLGGRVLAPLFSRPLTWRLLDIGVCLIVWAIALSLLNEVWHSSYVAELLS